MAADKRPRFGWRLPSASPSRALLCVCSDCRGLKTPCAWRPLSDAHEQDQPPWRDAASVDHEPHLALVGHRCDQRQALAARRDLDDRCRAAGRIAAVPALVSANASLVAPADLCLFPLRACDNLRILALQPEFYRRIVALISAPRRLLRRVAPTRQIVADSANR